MRSPYKKWTMADKKLIKENIDLPNQTLADMLGVSYHQLSCFKRVHKLTNPNIAPKIYRNAKEKQIAKDVGKHRLHSTVL